MDKDFLNHLAKRLETATAFEPADFYSGLNPNNPQDENTFDIDDDPDTIGRLQGFFMGADLIDCDLTPALWLNKGVPTGDLEAWAAIESTPDRDLPIPTLNLRQRAFQAVSFQPSQPWHTNLSLSTQLFRPWMLRGRYDAIIPADAAQVLRDCAAGEPPEQAWMKVALQLRKKRLYRLADIIETVPSYKEDGKIDLTPIFDFSLHELRQRLKTYSPHLITVPHELPDGTWIGNVMTWAYSLYGDGMEHNYDEVPAKYRYTDSMGSLLLGLNHYEATALCSGHVLPHLTSGEPVLGEFSYDEEAGYNFTSAGIARSLRLMADGCAPPCDDSLLSEVFAAQHFRDVMEPA